MLSIREPLSKTQKMSPRAAAKLVGRDVRVPKGGSLVQEVRLKKKREAEQRARSEARESRRERRRKRRERKSGRNPG